MTLKEFLKKREENMTEKQRTFKERYMNALKKKFLNTKNIEAKEKQTDIKK